MSRGNPAATGLSGTSEPLTDREKDFEGLKDLSESESKEPQSSRSKKRESSKEPTSKTPSRQAEAIPENWSNKEENSTTSNFRGQEEENNALQGEEAKSENENAELKEEKEAAELAERSVEGTWRVGDKTKTEAEATEAMAERSGAAEDGLMHGGGAPEREVEGKGKVEESALPIMEAKQDQEKERLEPIDSKEKISLKGPSPVQEKSRKEEEEEEEAEYLEENEFVGEEAEQAVEGNI